MSNKPSYQHLSTEQSNPNSTKHIGNNLNNHNHNKHINANLIKQKNIQKINKLYEQNQKLAYSINYLMDQNNFYKISINNIKKLNSNINKNLDAANNNANTNSSSNNANNVKQNMNLTGSKHITHATRQQSIHKTDSIQKFKSRTITAHIGDSDNYKENHNERFGRGTFNDLENNANPRDITEPYSLISNKIHLKNLQIKVGNSIRKADKLKKLYEGSLSILNKKVDSLQNQVNVLARQAQYHSIQNQLLQNIYSADFYITLSNQGHHKNQQQPVYQKQNTTQIKESLHCENGVSNNFITEEEIENLENYIRNSKKKLTSKTTKSDNNHQFHQEKKRPSIQVNNRKIVHKQITKVSHKVQAHPQITSMKNNNLGRFLSGYQTKPQIKLKSSSNSTYFPGKSSMSNRINELSKRAFMKNNVEVYKNNLHPIQGCSQFDQIQSLNININDAQSLQRFNSSNGMKKSQFDMKKNTKQIYQLPQHIIEEIISSLQNQEISQMNKIQSLRKQQKQQRKKRAQLNQKCQQYISKKNQLKAEIQSNFQHLAKNIKLDKGKSIINLADIHQRQSITSKLHQLNKKQHQLTKAIQIQDLTLQDQYKINQQYKQKIVDRNEQQAKEKKLLQEEVNKCLDQVRQVKIKYRDIVQQKKNKLKS